MPRRLSSSPQRPHARRPGDDGRDRPQRQLRRRGARARQGAFGADLQRAPARGRARRAAVRPALAPGDAHRRRRRSCSTRAGACSSEIDAVANRVKRVATGWETQLDDRRRRRRSRARPCSSCARRSTPARRRWRRPTRAASRRATPTPPATRLRLRTEVLAGTWEALITGQADLAIGVVVGRELPPGVTMKDLGHAGVRVRGRAASSAGRGERAARRRRADPPSRGRGRRFGAAAGADHPQPARRPGRAHGQRHAGQDRGAAARPRLRLRARADGARPHRRRPAGGQGRCSAPARGPPRLRLAHAGRGRGAARRRKPPLGPGPALVAGAAGERDDAQGAARAPRRPARRSARPAIRVDAPTSAASRPRPPACCTPARWSPRWPRGSMRAPTAGAGWCASRTSTRRATSPARPRRSSASSARCGLLPDEPPVRQSERDRALRGGAAPAAEPRAGPIPAAAAAATSRSPLAPAGRAAHAHAERVYPGTCRGGLHGKPRDRSALRTDARAGWPAGRGASSGSTAASAAQTRGRRRAASATSCCAAPTASSPTSWRSSSTMRRRASPTSSAAKTWPTTRARQILLQRLLGLPTPRYLHTPLVLGARRREAVEADRRPAARRWTGRWRRLRGAGRCSASTSRGTSLAEWLAAVAAGAALARCAGR